MDLLARTASDGVRAALKGKPREQLAKAIDVAIFQTIFRFQLVLRINALSHELIERQTMLDAIFAGQVAMLASATRTEPADPNDNQRSADLLGLILERVVELRGFELARAEVEARYLAGHPALFPDDAAAWSERMRSTTDLGFMALCLAELNGLPATTPAPAPEPTSEHVADLAADFVEPARAVTFELMDEGQRAYRIGTSWLRGKFEMTRDPR